MEPQKTTNDWEQLSPSEAYRLSQAEFKGMTLQALQDIRSEISEMKRDKEVRGYINYFISGVVALFVSMISGRKI